MFVIELELCVGLMKEGSLLVQQFLVLEKLVL
jgi:hypothetical protein